MKKIAAIFDFAAFIFFGAIFAFLIFFMLIVFSFFKRRRYKGGAINRFSFPVFDLISGKYPSMFEDTLLNGYISKDYYVYLDFNNHSDRFENIQGRIFFYSIAAHPDNGLYNAGFDKLNALFVELKLLAKAFSVVFRNDVSFIKAHDPHLLGLNGLVIARLFKLPFIMHMNSDFDMKYRGTGKVSSSIFILRSLERLFESLIINVCDLVIADRESYKHSRSFPKCSMKKYKVLGIRVDEKHYTEPDSRHNLKRKMGLGDNKKMLLYVGRLHPVKYPQDVVEAFAIIHRRLENTVLAIAGTGVLKEFLEDIVRKNNLQDNVLFLGQKTHEELADLFYTADVLLAPHGGVTLVESALASTPIVAYDFDWHPEFLMNGEMGYIVPFRDTEKLADKALEILKDEVLRKRMGTFCRKAVVSRYSRQQALENEKMIYDTLIKA